MGEENVSVLGQGQLFGEGRFIEVYNRQLREQTRLGVAAPIQTRAGAKQAQTKLPLELEDDESAKAPYSVRCISHSGVVWRIKGIDFFRWVLKDTNTTTQLTMNLRGRFNSIKASESNRHEEFKFHNVQGKEVDSDLDSGSDAYKSEGEKDMKDLQRCEKMQLKDILMEPGTDYREQLQEMASGFPKVKKALKLQESVSEWYDS